MSADELTQMSLRSAGKRARSVTPSMHNEHVVRRLCRRTPPRDNIAADVCEPQRCAARAHSAFAARGSGHQNPWGRR